MIVEIDHVSLAVDGKQLVYIPEWKIEPGKLYGLVGDTGSGKSTIGKWLANVEPVYWEVTENIMHQGDIPMSSGCEKTGDGAPLYLLQDAYKVFNPYIPILTHFKDIWKNHSHRTSINNFDEIFEILTNLGIRNPKVLIRRKVHQISQGEAQRLAFVLGLIRMASLRIYDEAFSNVDVEASKKMLVFLRKFCDRTHSSAILISHEISLIEGFIEPIYVIEDGQLTRMVPRPEEQALDKRFSTHTPLLEIHSLQIPGYTSGPKGKEVLCELPVFKIGQGEVVGLYGDSGIGKTTLLKGLLGEHPISWDECIIKEGNKGSDMGLEALDIRYLPQSVVSAFNPAYPLRDSISEILSVYQSEDQDVTLLMELFGLDKAYLDKFPEELSGGEIQRIGIITVLLGKPDLILLDESFASLDQATRETIWGALMQKQRDKLFSLLVVSHDVNWLSANMNRVYELMS